MTAKRVTISDVARAAGVSVAAASRILNNDPKFSVREETKKAVFKVMTELGYIPNPHARGLRAENSRSLAMIVPEINSPAFLPIIQGAQKAARERNYTMLLGGVGVEGEDPETAARILKSNRVDGFLIATGKHEKSQLAAAKSLQAPSVLVNRYLDDAHPYVVLDDTKGAAAIVSHLIEKGHVRIAFLGAVKRFLGTRRLAGYKQALKAANIAYDPALAIDAGYDRTGGEEGINKLVLLENPPTAIFATNHLVAAGAILAAKRHGLRVPEDISIASFYDGPVAELINPPLTSVSFPLERLGYESVVMLIGIIEGRPSESLGLVISHEGVVIRESTSKAPRKRQRATT